MKHLSLKYLSLILIIIHTPILFAQVERNVLILKRELAVNNSKEQQDVLKLKSGGNYKGEYIKIESAYVLFKPEGGNATQRINVNEIQMLKLADGTEVIFGGRVKRKANETVTIEPGDKIMVKYDKVSKSVTGLFHDFDNGQISVQRLDENQKVFYTNISANLVENIIILPNRSANSIPLVATSCSIIMFALSSLDGFDSEVGYVMAGLAAIAGGLGGIVFHKIENDRASKVSRYTLVGKDAWYIYNQDIK